MERHYGFDTLMVHAGKEYDKETGSVTVPLYMTTAYEFENADHARRLFALEESGNIYTRIMNPTSDMLEARITALEGGSGALALASGHAAIFLTIVTIARQGDEILSSPYIYGGAINMFSHSLAKLGITVRFVDPDQPQEVEQAINDKTKAIFVETVGNPNANVADLDTLAEIAHRNGVPLLVDSTFTTPYLIKPFEHGADIILHSATKFLGGHGTVMAGLVVDSGKFQWKGNPRFPDFNDPDPSYHGVVFADLGPTAFITKLRTQMLRDYGPCISPFNSFMILQGIETLSLRMRKHCDNALAVAKFLEGHPMVEKVHYPGLESSRYHKLAQKYLPKGSSAVFTFEIKGGKKAGEKFINSLELLLHVTNVGDVRSLVSHPASTTHSQLNEEQLNAAGITPGTIRLSIGLEDAEDLIADLSQALDRAAQA